MLNESVVIGTQLVHETIQIQYKLNLKNHCLNIYSKSGSDAKNWFNAFK